MDHYLLQFFEYDHLSADKQQVSKLFAELAADVCAEKYDPEYCADAIRILVARIRREFNDNQESAWAQLKLLDAELVLRETPDNRGDILRKILEAKDCGVRSVIFRAQQA